VDGYPAERVDAVMNSPTVGHLWGVVGRTTKKLTSYGIQTIRKLRDADPRHPEVVKHRAAALGLRAVFRYRRTIRFR
jgi:nucleotidyltransferase/DNA polymerase involved in DNA repair